MSRQVKRPIDPSHYPKRTRKQQLLCEAIEQDCQQLQRDIQLYVSRVIQQFGSKFDKTCDRYSVETVAQEILHETIETALKKADKFDPNRSACLWLLGIATKKIKRWQREQTQESNWVTPVAKLHPAQFSSESSSEEEILGLLHQFSESSDSDSQLMLEYLLSLVKDSDREVIKLAFVDGKTGKSLAAALGTTEGAAYTKKHRAIARLRQAYAQATQKQEEGR